MGRQINSKCHYSGNYCSEIYTDENIGFKKISSRGGGYYKGVVNSYYNLVFMLKGEAEFSYNNFLERVICEGEILLVPSETEFLVHSLKDSCLLVLTFDERVNSLCDKGLLYYCQSCYRPEIQYTSHILKMTSQLHLLLEQVEKYIELQLLCPYMSDLKEKELFALFPHNYSKEELCEFFYPISISDIYFRTKIIECLRKKMGVAEMANHLNMSPKTFGRRFMEEFGEMPRVWLQKQKAKQIKVHLLHPQATLMDIVVEYNFTDMSHFSKFCKEHYGCTPMEILKLIREKNKS